MSNTNLISLLVICLLCGCTFPLVWNASETIIDALHDEMEIIDEASSDIRKNHPYHKPT